MPDYSAPGVYVQGGPNPHPIIGVSTSTAAIVGAVRSPFAPMLLTSFEQYLTSIGQNASGFLSYAVRGFFQNGGTRCYVAGVVPGHDVSRALEELEKLDDVSIVCSPDAQTLPGINEALIDHAEKMRYRFAVLDAPQSPAPADGPPERLRSAYAAYYYPWLVGSDVNGQGTISFPPCGHVVGIYAATDQKQGVWHAPANKPIMGISGLDQVVTDFQSEALNAKGADVLRHFAGEGDVVWGARTTSTDPQWKYINIRRYFIYLEHSIETGTQWAVFENNGPDLWAQVRNSINDFLFNEWKNGALQGDKPENAFFVRCDQTTMTQNDLDNGRLVVEVGVAPLRPAEFVIFRICQFTAKATSAGC